MALGRRKMKALCQDRYGSAEVLQLREADKPVPAQGQVLVRVQAASVNALDWHHMTGRPLFARLMMGLSKPKRAIRGVDLSGVVEAVGPGVTKWTVGDEVFGTANGSFAEYVATAEGNLAKKPPTVTFENAAAVPVAAFTALEGLRDHGKVRPGQSVLVYGAGGGVGSLAVQIAKSLGARVTAVTTTEKVEMARALGAADVVDYTKDDFSKQEGRYDVILDIGANRPLRVYRRVLAARGIYVMIGAPTGGTLRILGRFLKIRLISLFVSQGFDFFVAKGRDEDLSVLRDLLAEGKLSPVIDRRFPLREAAEAIRYVQSGRAHGKVVVKIT